MPSPTSRFASIAALAVSSLATAQPLFPVPRAEAEFRVLVAALAQRAEAVNGDVNSFVQQSLPCGPLDLLVSHAANPEEAAALRNFYLGVLGTAARVDVARLANRFHCGPECAAQRQEHLTSLLPGIRQAVDLFRQQRGLAIVAAWQPSGHRLNNFFLLDDHYSEAVPSATMGFIPSGTWRSQTEPHALEQVGITSVTRDRLLALLRASDLAALVKTSDGSVRAIWAGIADNEVGLLFTSPSSPEPSIGQALANGGSFVALSRLSDAIYFYTTS